MGETTGTGEFLGVFQHAMDAKGRLVLPAQHRNLLEGGELVMTLGFDRCITVHPMGDWSEVTASLRQAQRGDVTARRLARAIFANASHQELDKQGRVTLPQLHREYAAINGDVAVVGVSTHIELWDAEAWNRESEAARNAYTNTTDPLGFGGF